jgi:hypothetical protein
VQHRIQIVDFDSNVLNASPLVFSQARPTRHGISDLNHFDAHVAAPEEGVAEVFPLDGRASLKSETLSEECCGFLDIVHHDPDMVNAIEFHHCSP